MRKNVRGGKKKTSLYKQIDRFFDLLEDRVRARLSRRPILYAFISGVGSVLFFYGVWHIADVISGVSEYSIWIGITALAISLFLLLITGTFAFHFVSDQAIVSGIRQEKKLIEKTAKEIENEEVSLKEIKSELDEIEDVVVRNGSKLKKPVETRTR